MSRGSVTTGTCPRCFTEQPLIWDGTVRPHSVDEDGIRWDCEGSLHAPTSADVRHCPSCTCEVQS